MSTFLLNTKLRRSLLAYSFTHADEDFYVRQLATLIGQDPGNLSRELRRLEEEGLYKTSLRGKIKFYSLNKDYPFYGELKKILFKTEGVEGSLRDVVAGYSGIKLAFIYGSVAKAQEKKNSDIDLALVGKFDRDKFTDQIRKLESKLNREVNFTSYTPQEFREERNKPGSFIDLVVKGKVVLLKGTLNDR